MIRDQHSNALLETDVLGLQKYRKEKKQDKDIQYLKDEVQSLRLCLNRLYDTIERMESRL